VIRFVDHQDTGSEGFCRYATRGVVRGVLGRERSEGCEANLTTAPEP
jgi:hypothetical protein